MNNVRGRVWRDAALIVEDFLLDDLDGYLADPTLLVWLDLCEPDLSTVQQLAHELNLDPTAVTNALSPGERPKATKHANHTFVTVYDTCLDHDGTGIESRLRLSRVSAFVLPNGLITIRTNKFFNIDDVLARWNDNPELLSHGPAALLRGLLDKVIDGHFSTIQAMDDAMEDLEDGLFSEQSRPALIQQRVYRLRKELVQLRRVVLPMREVVSAVLRHRVDFDHLASQQLDPWFEDLYDHVLRATEWTESLRDLVGSIVETNLALQDSRLNTVMKKLAGWAAIIAVPTLVTGWFGQNVPFPGFNASNGLWFSIVTIVLSTLGLYVVFRKADWI